MIYNLFRQGEINKEAAELAKYFGNVRLECIELEGSKESDIDRIYVLFEGNHHSDPKNRYRILETVYKSYSQRDKDRIRDKITRILQAMPYGHLGIGQSAYKADKFFEQREKGLLLETEKWAYERMTRKTDDYWDL